MAFVPWTEEEDEQLRKLARSGCGMVEIAQIMQRTKSSVRNRVQNLNIAIARQENPMRRGRLGVTSK
jgi:predicted transcriptional regulator